MSSAALAQSRPDTLAQCFDAAGANVGKLYACRSPEIARENARLNVAYKRLYARLNPYRRTLLGKSQAAWISFRKVQCDFESSQLVGGPLGIEARAQVEALNRCLTDQTRSRVRALKDAYGIRGNVG